MNLDDLRKKARGGDLKPEKDKDCDFDGCDNFATYRDEEGSWCHTHRIKMIRESVTRGTNSGGSAFATMSTGFFAAATGVIFPSSPPTSVPSSGPAMPPLAPVPPVLSVTKSDISKIKTKNKKASKVKRIARNAKDFCKGFMEGLDEDRATKK